MKKILFLVVAIFFLSCENEQVTNECFRGINFNEVIYLNNPEFLKISTPGGYVISSIGGRNILVLNRANNFKAFDLQCPGSDCNDPMTFDYELKLICPCTKKEYSSYNGSPIDGKGCFALEYIALQNGDQLQISRN